MEFMAEGTARQSTHACNDRLHERVCKHRDEGAAAVTRIRLAGRVGMQLIGWECT
jgi:hypothetical protein